MCDACTGASPATTSAPSSAPGTRRSGARRADVHTDRAARQRSWKSRRGRAGVGCRRRDPMDEGQAAINRRRFIECFSALGLGSTLVPGALAAVVQDAATITIDMLQSAERIAGVSFTADERARLLEKLNAPRGYMAGFARLRAARSEE